MGLVKNKNENHISEGIIKRLLLSHNLVIGGRIFFELFLSVFIWKQTSSVTAVALFNIAYLLTHTITFTIFASVVKLGRVHLPRKLGLIGFAIIYFVIYLLSNSAINYIIPLGIGIGFFNGLYWISYQVIRFDLTHTKNRGNYTGWEGAIKTLVELIIPVLGGFIIILKPGNNGYADIFLIGTIFFLISFVLGNVNYEPKTRHKMNMQKSFSYFLQDKDILKSMFGYLFSGLGRTGSLYRVILPLFIFIALQNEFELGGLLSFFSLVAILTSLTIGKYVDYKHYKLFLSVGGVLYFFLVLSLIFFPSLTIYILFGISIKILLIFIKIPKRVISENLISNIDEHHNHRVEYMVMREWFNVGLGRILSYVLLLFATGMSSSQLKYILIILAISIMLETILLRTINLKKFKI